MKYVEITTVLLFLGGTPVFSQAGERPKTQADLPNVILILADDLGYGDIQCYNPDRGKIATPNIDRLAQEGIRFTDAHASGALCTPSRYGLLTGQYHIRSLSSNVLPFGEPVIAADRMTLGSLAQKAGYRTACIGKWHLGMKWPIPQEIKKELTRPKRKYSDFTEEERETWRSIFSQPILEGPTTRGFDYYFGTDAPNWPPFCFIENDATVGIPCDPLPENMIKEPLVNLAGPALKGWSFNQILPTLIDKSIYFINKDDADKSPFFLYLALTAPHAPLAVNEPWVGKSKLNLYADFVMEMDDSVGRLLAALEQTGQADNTLVIFTSDNGAPPVANYKELEKKGHYPSGYLKKYKFSAYEGGHRMPFIVRWPKVIKPNTVSDHLVHHVDIMATLAEIIGYTLPTGAGEDSVSLMPLLMRNEPVRRYAVSASPGKEIVLRDGKWKYITPLVKKHKEDRDRNVERLFNLEQDIGEKNNLAAEFPERLKQMKDILKKILSASNK